MFSSCSKIEFCPYCFWGQGLLSSLKPVHKSIITSSSLVTLPRQKNYMVKLDHVLFCTAFHGENCLVTLVLKGENQNKSFEVKLSYEWYLQNVLQYISLYSFMHSFSPDTYKIVKYRAVLLCHTLLRVGSSLLTPTFLTRVVLWISGALFTFSCIWILVREASGLLVWMSLYPSFH